ncbi:1-phosphofructokinase family hexose kinase [Alsobacter sp. R-9]
MRIVTYTPNPAVDLWSACEEIRPTEKIRVGETRYDPGGGGINVARVLHTLGTEVFAVYCAGGATRSLFDTLLQRTGVPGHDVPIAGDTRVSSVVRERSTGREYRFVPEGPEVTPDECAAALAALEAARGDWLVASGSLPRGMPVTHYVDVARLATQRGMAFALDVSGRTLEATVAAGGIALLKVSQTELEDLVGHPLGSPDTVAAAARELCGTGRVRQVVVSLGPDGAVLADARKIVTATAPRIAVMSTVGAGDSFLGGLLHGFACGFTDEEALRLAVAAGSAACLREGTQLASRGDVERLLAG